MVITTTGFTNIARAAGKAEGISGLRVAEYPGAVGVHPEALVEKNVENVLFDRIVAELTMPRAGDDRIALGAVRGPNEIVFEGTFEEIDDYFKRQLWTDELPIVPPTLERVEAFLEHTKRAPDERIAVLPQANLAAVPWNIAANAVMAGCRPEHMPVLIAAVEAIADNAYNLNNIGSTWGVLPFLLVNGPAAAKLGIENGAQLVNKGANPAIGRALGLIIRNIAGYKLSRNYMGTFGYPLNFVVAENEAECPWEPYHVEHGFDRSDSTVTACGTVTWGWPPAIYGTEEKIRRAGRAGVSEHRVHEEALPGEAGRARRARIQEHDHVPDRAARREGAGRRRIHEADDPRLRVRARARTVSRARIPDRVRPLRGVQDSRHGGARADAA